MRLELLGGRFGGVYGWKSGKSGFLSGEGSWVIDTGSNDGIPSEDVDELMLFALCTMIV